MSAPEINAITGAFGYTGKYITHRLLAMDKEVRTLTGHPNNPNPFDEQVRVYPFNFDNFAELVKSLQGATTFYNTYWIRFSHGACATFPCSLSLVPANIVCSRFMLKTWRTW